MVRCRCAASQLRKFAKEIPNVEVDDLVQASKKLRENIATNESELELSVTRELM